MARSTAVVAPNVCTRCGSDNTTLEVWSEFGTKPCPTLRCNVCEASRRPVQVAFYGSCTFVVVGLTDRSGHVSGPSDLLEEVMLICRRNGLEVRLEDVNVMGVDPA